MPLRVLTLLAIGWYLLLATVHYFYQRPLWEDEGYIFNNLHDLTAVQIFHQPLVNLQQFPRVYLVLMQWFSSVFHFSLLALRFLPFICMVGAFLVWLRLAREGLAKESQRLTFVLCWAASIPLVYYAAELKQYSMDVLAAALFLLFLSHQPSLRQRPGRYLPVLILLPCLGLFSYPVFFMMVFPLINIIRLGGRWQRDLCIYALACLAVVVFVYWFDVRIGHGARLREYWHDYFISYDSVGEFFRTFTEGVNNLISRWFAEKPKWIRGASRFFMAFGLWQLLAGFWKSFKKDGYIFTSVQTIALIVFIEMVILGSLQLYVFTVPRTALFFCPILLFLAVQGMEGLRAWHNGVFWAVRGAFVAYLLIVSVGIAGVVFKGPLGAQSVIFNGK